MNPLDWLLTVIVAYSVLRAASRGFFREAFALAGLILGLVLACWDYQAVAPLLKGLVDSTPLTDLLAFLLLLVGVMMLATLLGALLSKSVSAIGLGWLDRLGGAAFGLLRGALFVAALLLAVTLFAPAAPWLQTQTRTSLLTPYFLRANHAVSFGMPFDMQQRFADGLQRFRYSKPH